MNTSNVMRYVPDLPDEAFTVAAMDSAATSDVMRTALLAHHGGVWLDSDLLLAQPLASTIAPLADHDAVVYASTSRQEADRGFSSNFIAARTCLPHWLLSWRVVKETLTRRCPESRVGEEPRSRGFCCERSRSNTDRSSSTTSTTTSPPPRWCRSPGWGSFGEVISMPMLAALRRHLDGSSPYAPRLFTYAANESFTPSAGAASSPFNVYVQRLGQCAVEAGGLRLRWEYERPPPRFFEPLPFNGSACCKQRGPALECWRVPHTGRRPMGSLTWPTKGRPVLTVERTFFRRRAYHIFNHVHGHPSRPDGSCAAKYSDACAYSAMGSEAQIERGPWVLSRLLRTALGDGVPESGA